jgi:hypothetical protein
LFRNRRRLTQPFIHQLIGNKGTRAHHFDRQIDLLTLAFFAGG